MGPGAGQHHHRPHRPLAAGLHRSPGGLAQKGHVCGQQVGAHIEQLPQSAVGHADLLAGVEQPRNVHRRLGHRGGQLQHHRQRRLHVGGSEAPQHVALYTSSRVVIGGHGVAVAADQHPQGPVQIGASHHVVAHSVHGETGHGPQFLLNEIGDFALVVGHRGDIDQLSRLGQQISAHGLSR